jgi:hypothetical protein
MDINEIAEQEILDQIEGVDMNDLVRIYKMGMKKALLIVLKAYTPDGNPKRWLDKIENLMAEIEG